MTSFANTMLKPSTLGLSPTFGFGDRLGLATPGHLAALSQAGGPIQGIFAQQSIRELTRTQRAASEVMNAAAEALSAANYEGLWGADADHLKTQSDVEAMAEAGFVFFTIDPSEHVDQKSDGYDEATLKQKFSEIQSEIDWIDDYIGKTIRIQNGPIIDFNEPVVVRAAVKYGLAIRHTMEMARFIRTTAEGRDQPFEIEVSIDETEEPTSLAEHFIFADQLRRHDVRIISLAPRFIGELEKGIDYKGDLSTLEKSLADHAAIASELGPYKLSLHSGSDKISMYSLLAKATQGRFHIKTAGTSYLEALRVVARCSPDNFRKIINFSRDRYDTDKATYCVSATLADVAPPEAVSTPQDLEDLYLDRWENVPPGKGFTAPGRQILHCTFGSVLTHLEMGAFLKQILNENAQVHAEILTEHFTRHLQALNAG